MKIIIGKAGQGKTIKVADLAMEALESVRNVLICSDELSWIEFYNHTHARMEGILSVEPRGTLVFKQVDRVSQGDIFKAIADHDVSIVFVDAYLNERNLALLDIVCKQLNIECYKTLQANAHASNGAPLQIIDWDEHLGIDEPEEVTEVWKSQTQ